MHGVSDLLFLYLEVISLICGDFVRGSKMSYEIRDGILFFYVSYNLFLIKLDSTEESDDELMGNVNLLYKG
jgi:hypothetical protein